MEGDPAAESIFAALAFLQKHQQARMRQSLTSARLYGNIPLYGSAGVAYARLIQSQSATKDRMTFNAIQSVVDTVVARIGETKPKPYFLTSGGNYKAQRKAKKLNQFVEGCFYETRTYDLGLEAFRDAAIWGDGFIHVFGRNGKIVHERVMESELWIDEEEGKYGFPRTLYRYKSIDRDELAGYMPDKKKQILNASADVKGIRSNSVADLLQVIECWHLGSVTPDGEYVGGKHCIAIKEHMLVEESWDYNLFPFAKIPWAKRPIGYFSQGVCERRQGEQIELNNELWLIQRSMKLAGTVKVFLRNGSKVVKEHINNEIGAIISHTGEPPVFFCPEPIHQVYFENVNRIIERIYRGEGVSELTASSKKPEGLDSGAAIREYEDIESDRFRSISRQNDNLYLDICKLDVLVAQELAEGKHGPKVRVPSKRAFEEIDWKRDIGNLKDSEYVLQCFPISRLPRDPAGRLQTIQEYIQAGFMTPRQGRRALDFPDLDTIESLANAQEDLVTKILDDIIDSGEYRPPEPTDDLSLDKELVVEYIQRYRLLELEDDKMAMLRAWSSQVDAFQSQAEAAMAPPPGMPAGGTPQAVPTPPPVSQLLPNAPQKAA